MRYTELGTQIQRLRRRRGLTQEQLAQRAGIHRVTVARLEAATLTPALATLEILARTLGARVRLTLTPR